MDADIPEPAPELLAEVHGDLAALAQARYWRLGVVLGVAAALVGALAFRAPSHVPATGTPLHWAVLIGYATSGLILCVLAFGVRIPAGRRLRWVALAGAVGGLGLLTAMVSDGPSNHPFMKGAACLGTGMGLALAIGGFSVVLGRRVLRRHAPSGWLLGVGSGLFALVTLHVACTACPTSYTMSWVWHGLVPVLSGVVMALVWRFARPE